MEFKEWMEHALYDQKQGYYATRLEGLTDYITAPNFGPYLGWAIAHEILRAWKAFPDFIASDKLTLIEAGCGPEGSLTQAVLSVLAKEAPALFVKTQVIMVDRSIGRLERAIANVGKHYPDRIFGCPDIGQLPRFSGVLYSNELIDAMPVFLIQKKAHHEILQAVVEEDASQKRQLEWRSANDPVIISYGLDLPENIPYALNLEALRFLALVAGRMEHGFLMTIDFGETRPAVFGRSPIKGFLNHKIKIPSLDHSGEEDITSPVDFTLLMEEGSRLGLEVIQYEKLGSFFMRNKGNEFFSPLQDSRSLKENLKIKTLIHPFGFGEDFKVLIQGK